MYRKMLVSSFLLFLSGILVLNGQSKNLADVILSGYSARNFTRYLTRTLSSF